MAIEVGNRKVIKNWSIRSKPNIERAYTLTWHVFGLLDGFPYMWKRIFSERNQWSIGYVTSRVLGTSEICFIRLFPFWKILHFPHVPLSPRAHPRALPFLRRSNHTHSYSSKYCPLLRWVLTFQRASSLWLFKFWSDFHFPMGHPYGFLRFAHSPIFNGLLPINIQIHYIHCSLNSPPLYILYNYIIEWD